MGYLVRFNKFRFPHISGNLHFVTTYILYFSYSEGANNLKSYDFDTSCYCEEEEDMKESNREW